MKKSNRQSASAFSDAQIGEPVCENTDSHALEQKASDAISPAISLAVSPRTNENYITELDGDQSSNQSGEKSPLKPDCYKCKWRRATEFSHHSRCAHPLLSAVPGAECLPLVFMLNGLRSPFEKRLNLSYSRYGFNSGWFFWPINFDPVWLDTCDGFETI